MTQEMAWARRDLDRFVRQFFDERGFLQVDPPLLSPYAIPEAHIRLFQTSWEQPNLGNAPPELYLIPSPELWLKRLIAEGWGAMYFLGRCFRNGEALGRYHNPEFTMLEWYEPDAEEDDALETLKAFVREIPESKSLRTLTERAGTTSLFRAKPLELTVAEAFEHWANIRLVDGEGLFDSAFRSGYEPRPDEDWKTLFHRILVTSVEPALPDDQLVILRDYPAAVRTLAQRKPAADADRSLQVRGRWEAYLGGLELANCYRELADPHELDDFLEQEQRTIQDEGRTPPEPPPGLRNYLAADGHSWAGVALGFDRLLMAVSGTPRLEGVIFFPLHDSVQTSTKRSLG